MTRTLIFALTLAAAVSGCSSHDTTTAPGDGMTVAVQDNSYAPAPLSIAPGGRVHWDWKGANLHTVTFDDGPASETQVKGTFERTFTTAGTYRYHCLIHGLAMSGTVQVQ